MEEQEAALARMKPAQAVFERHRQSRLPNPSDNAAKKEENQGEEHLPCFPPKNGDLNGMLLKQIVGGGNPGGVQEAKERLRRTQQRQSRDFEKELLELIGGQQEKEEDDKGRGVASKRPPAVGKAGGVELYTKGACSSIKGTSIPNVPHTHGRAAVI